MWHTYRRGSPVNSLNQSDTLHCRVLDKQLRFRRWQVCVSRIFLTWWPRVGYLWTFWLHRLLRWMTQVERPLLYNVESTYLPQPNIVSWPIDQLHLVREEKEKHPWTTSLKCLNVGCTRVRICKNSVAAFVWGWHSIDEFGQDRGACSAQVTSQGERLRETSPRSWRDWSGLIVKALDWSNRLTLNLYCKLAPSNPFSEWFRSGSVQSDGGQRGPYHIIWHTYGKLQSTIGPKLSTSFSSALGFR